METDTSVSYIFKSQSYFIRLFRLDHTNEAWASSHQVDSIENDLNLAYIYSEQVYMLIFISFLFQTWNFKAWVLFSQRKQHPEDHMYYRNCYGEKLRWIILAGGGGFNLVLRPEYFGTAISDSAGR